MSTFFIRDPDGYTEVAVYDAPNAKAAAMKYIVDVYGYGGELDAAAIAGFDEDFGAIMVWEAKQKVYKFGVETTVEFKEIK